MKVVGKTVIIVTLSLITVLSLFAQVIIRREGGGKQVRIEGEPFMLREVGAIIIATGDTLTVEHVMPKDNRLKGYGDIDIQEGDRILMANAKRMKTTKDINALYESLPIGSELKLGIRRNDETLVIELPKADPKDLPQMKIQLGGGGNFEALPAVGVMLTSEKNKVLISQKMEDDSSALARADIKEKDEIVEMNNKPVTSLKQLMDSYDALKVGATIEWKIKRGKNTFAVSFKKPQPKVMTIRREIRR